MFTHDQVVCFCSVYEHGSYSAAARALERNRTTVREHVVMLEDGIAESLFEIHGRSAMPTEIAHRLYPRAKVLVRQLQEFRQEAMSSWQEKLSALTLYYDVMIPLDLITAVEAHCAKAFPHLRINWLLRGREEAISDLLEGSAHLALMPVLGKALTEREVIFTNLGMVRCSAYCRPDSPLLESGPLRISDLKLYKQYINEDHFHSLRHQLQVSPQFHLVSSNDLLLTLLEADGWAMLPDTVAQSLCRQGRLHRLEVEELIHTINYNICTFHAPAAEQHPVISHVLEAVKNYARMELN